MKRLLTLLLLIAAAQALCGLQAILRFGDDGRSLYPADQRQLRALVVPVCFYDRNFTISDPQSQFDRLLNERGYADNGAHGSAADYFEDCSNGKFRPVFDVTHVVKLPKSVAWYCQSKENWQQGMRQALLSLDKDVDYGLYDADDDGTIDNIHFFFAGISTDNPQNFTYFRPCIDTYSGTTLLLDGKRFFDYSCSSEIRGVNASRHPVMVGIGPFCHAYAHTLGLPLLYPIREVESTASPGGRALLDSGYLNDNTTCPPLLSAYEQWMLHWLEIDDVEGNDTIVKLPSLASLERKAVRVRCPQTDGVHPYEYFIVETRGGNLWDSSLPDQGMLIWHVNYHPTYWSNNVVNNMTLSRFMPVMCNPDVEGAEWPGTDLDYAIASSGWTEGFAPVMAPPSLFSATLCMSYDATAGVGTFILNPVDMPEQPDDTVRMREPVITDWPGHSLNLRWHPVDDTHCVQTQYIVSVYYYSNNKGIQETIYMPGCKSLRTSHPQCAVTGLSDADWNREWLMTVRTVHALPSSALCEPIRFVPALCSDISEIIEVASDDCDAPEHWFTLQGIPLQQPPESHGIYLRQKGSKTEKIMLK